MNPLGLQWACMYIACAVAHAMQTTLVCASAGCPVTGACHSMMPKLRRRSWRVLSPAMMLSWGCEDLPKVARVNSIGL